ncbi:MAG: type II toxin-antitoxin system HipA family toxin [Thiobacillaceae bacterium]
MKKLKVIFCGWGERWPLGTLADNGSTLLFEYAVEALERQIEFSPRHLKLRETAYGDFPAFQHRLPGLIADALPDGWGLLLMDRLFRQRGLAPETLSPLDRLAFIADRAMGALSFEPAETLKLPTQNLELLNLAQEARTLINDKDSLALKQMVILGGSPHGARPKVLVQFDEATKRISNDTRAPGIPWLVKFQARGEHKEVCAIEHCYAEMARLCGLDMRATRYFDLDAKLAGFGVERFDREAGLRVPIHTLAGALHANFQLPSLDYATYLRATRMFTRDEREVEKAFERCVFNLIFNNRDDHAKNFAFRMNRDFQWKLAPCYDLTYRSGAAGEHQMSVMGEGKTPGKAHLLRLAKDSGLNEGNANQVIDRMSTVAVEFKKLIKDHPVRVASVKTINHGIEANLGRLM